MLVKTCSKLKYIEFVLMLGLVIGYGLASHHRNSVWKDNFSLWSDVVGKSPRKARPHLRLGTACMERGLYDQSIPEFNEVLRLDSHIFPQALYNLGLSYEKKGLPDQAVIAYQKAIYLNPDYAMVHVNLGLLYKDQGLIEEAMAHYKKAVELKPYHPKYVQAYINLGLALREKGLIDDAIVQYAKVVQFKPDYAPARNDLGVCYFEKGWTDKAVEQFETAIRIDPDHIDAHYNLGVAYGSKGLYDKALEEIRKARALGSRHE